MGERGTTRRELLAQGAVGALALSGLAATSGAVLAACGGEAGRTTSRRYPSPPTTEPVDSVEDPWWLQGNFAPVKVERTVTELEVKGALPPELSGLYVRNGSNPLAGRSPHWFLGDGMVHGVSIDRGKASWYRNRYVDTAYLRAGGGLGKGVPGGDSTLSNVSVVHHAGRTMSLGEVGQPIELSPDDLATIGPVDFGGQLKGNYTAHPKVDPVTGDLHGFGYNFAEPYLEYHHLSADGQQLTSQVIDVPRSTMMHDFAITDRDVVFMDFPVAFDMPSAIKMISDPASGAVPFIWKPKLGARLGVMPLGGTASELRWVEIDPCYVYHGVHARREGDEVVLDVCRMDSTFAPPGTPSRLTRNRWRINTSGEQLRFRDERIDAPPADLPTVDRRFVGRAARHSWLGEVVSTPGQIGFSGCQHLDGVTGKVQRWIPAGGRRSGEWLFVPTGEGEGEGYVMAYVFDPRRNASSLVVLDALDVSAGPVAEVVLPVRVPFGFHATFVEA